MSEQRAVRLGLVGVGSMGAVHARDLLAGKVQGAELAAVCDVDGAALAPYADLPRFEDSERLIASGLVDALLIATPHYDHTPISIAGLGAGLHVLTEKPLAVHKRDCELMIAAYEQRPRREQVFAEMFNQRTDPRYRKLKQLLESGELGELRRVNWIITDWFRTEAYYRSGGWRATWRGEGGGVLLNQCPHNLDLWQWLFGMPARVRAFCGLGRFHEIECEDAVTAYLEYEGGATGVFITTTGEAPGTNRLEIAADRGRVVLEGDSMSFLRNEQPAAEYSKTSSERYSAPPVWQVKIPVSGGGSQHVGIMQNFVNAIRHGEPLIAPAPEGIHSVELANAMLWSSFRNETLSLPLDAAGYAEHLSKLVAESRFRKPEALPRRADDVARSFGS